MKKRRIALMIALCVVAGATFYEPLVYAHDGEEHSHSGHDSKFDESIADKDLLGQIHSIYVDLTDSISKKVLAGVHDKSESLSSLALTLSKKLTGPDAKRTEGLLNNLRKVADSLHESADKNDLVGAQANLKKMDALLKMIDDRFNYSFQNAAVHSHGTEHPHGESCSVPDVTVNINSRQYAFEPTEIRVKKGQKVCLKLTSQDVEHGIMIDDYHVHVHGQKDKPGEVQFVADRTGEFNFICHQVCGTGHGDMKGKFIVE